jgi:hypothetical protein
LLPIQSWAGYITNTLWCQPLRDTGDELKLFLIKNIELFVNREQYREHFGSAMGNFLAACRELATKNNRLAFVVKGAFARANLSAALDDGGST